MVFECLWGVNRKVTINLTIKNTRGNYNKMSTDPNEPIFHDPIVPAETLTPPPARRERSRALPILLSLITGTVGGALISHYHSQNEIKQLSDIVYSQTEIPAHLRSDLEIGNYDKKEPSNTLQDLVVDWHEAKNLRQLSSLSNEPSPKGAKVSYNGCKDLREDADSLRTLLNRYSSLPGDELKEPSLRTLGNRTIVSMTNLLDGCAANIANTPSGTELAEAQKQLKDIRAEIAELEKSCAAVKQTTASADGTNNAQNNQPAANYVNAPCVDTACPPVPVCPSTSAPLQTTCPVIDVKTTKLYQEIERENRSLIDSAQGLNAEILALEQKLSQAQLSRDNTSACPEYLAVNCETEPLSNGAELGIATYGQAIEQALSYKSELDSCSQDFSDCTDSLSDCDGELRELQGNNNNNNSGAAIPVDAPTDVEDLDATLANDTACQPTVCPEAQALECPPIPAFNLERECSTYRPADTNKDRTINGDDLTCKQLATEYLKPKPENAAPSVRTRAEARTSAASYDCTSQGGHRYDNLAQLCGDVERLVDELTTCEDGPARTRDNCGTNCEAQVNERYQRLKADLQDRNKKRVMDNVAEVVCGLVDKTTQTPTLGGIYDIMFVDLKGVSSAEVQETRQSFIVEMMDWNPQLKEQADKLSGDVEYRATCKR